MTDELLNRRVLGRYRVLRPLATGGMGVIYLGRSEGAAGFAKPVVIKRIEPTYMRQDEEAEAYFVNEAKILSQMRHPGIVSVIDFGREANGAYVMVLEYVHGYTLTDWLRYHRAKNEHFPAEEALYVVRRVLEALEYAHMLRAPDGTSQGIVHRDVTPSNVLIDVDGHIKLADFGIASIRSSEEEEGSGAQKIRGKLSYLAPELVSGAHASISSDVYSAALVLHELLLGRNEFRTGETASTVHRVASHVPTAVSSERDDTSTSLDAVLAAALAKSPADRYPTAEALAEDLRLVQRASDAEIERSLKQRVRADFEGDMPARLRLEPLDVRSAALNVSRPSEPPAEVAEPPRARRGARSALAGALVVALVAMGGGAFALFATPERPAPTQPRYIVVERNAPAATLDPPGAAPAPEPTSPPEPTPRPTGEETAPASASPASRTTRPITDEARLTRAFAAHRRAVQACYERHTVELSGSPRVEIQFRIRENGDVESVALAPANLGGTALGQCIVGVARRVRFGAQERPLRFTIPVTASVERR